MDWENLKNKVDVTNKIVMTLAIVVGGIWVLLSFVSEFKHERAKSELESSIRANQPREGLEVIVDTRALPKYRIKVQVSFHNKGNRDIKLHLHENSLRVTQITVPEPPNQPELKRAQIRLSPLSTNIKGESAKIVSLLIPAGGQNSLLYLAQVNEPGQFLVEFSAPRIKDDKLTSGEEVELAANEILDVSQ